MALLQGLSLIRKPDTVLQGVHYRFNLYIVKYSKIKAKNVLTEFRIVKAKME